MALETTLVTAVLAAFGKAAAGQLGRFARSVVGEKIGLAVEGEQSATAQAVRLARELLESGQLSDAVFDALRRVGPEYADLVEVARRDWLETQQAAPAASPNAGPKETTDPWLQALDAALDQAQEPPAPPQEWLDAAALLPSFDPRHLARIPGEDADGSRDDALVAMAPLVEQDAHGDWVLKSNARRSAIARMVREGSLSSRLELAEHLDPERRHAVFLQLQRQIATAGWIEVGFSDPQDRLLAAQAIADWFQQADVQPVERDRLSVILEARTRIEPLRKLVGTHFRNRVDELATLEAPDGFGAQGQRVLALTGIGGVGKSALIGRYVLSCVDREQPAPVVYLDFDRSEVDAGNPQRLVELMARQLGLLYAGRAASAGFYALEAASASDVPYLDQQLADWLPAGSTVEAMLAGLGRRLDGLGRGDLVLIFDTFELVSVRGPEIAGRFAGFVRAVLGTLPAARVVVSGRGRITLDLDMHAMALKNLDPLSADAVLLARGVADSQMRARIIEAMGCSPLVLRLAATAVQNGRLRLDDIAQFEAQASSTKTQGLLYTRILGHIRDPQIERLAHPGMVVRRLTAEIIRDVLADVCAIDPAEAEALFARLPAHIDLFEPASDSGAGQAALADPGALRHRQDLREAIIDTMLGDPRWRDMLPCIHQRAATYYTGRPDPVSRAERLYHLLMLDADPELLDTLWDPQIESLLARSSEEPLPPRARAWLGLRLGRDWSDSGQDMRLVDWEIRTARVARDRLAGGDAQGALDVLRERTDRSAASPLTAIEAGALVALGQADKALALAEQALTATDTPAAHRLALHQLAAEIASQHGQDATAAAHAQRAAQLADAAGDVAARLRAMEVLSRVHHSPENVRDLERVFTAVPAQRLRSDEQLVANVVRTIGTDSNAVLRKAALALGDLPQQHLLTNDVGTWRHLFETVQQQPGGEQMLASFAPRVGLGSQEHDPLRFAAEVLRHGRRGEAIDAVLNAFGDSQAVASGSLAVFKGTL
ncbi:hypothetical protein [Pseudorhodoferax sp.]|uniref:hypothetical protein n=1 Tax=Pseudorhodoferax sp. TaxID=1993553 RepID=UPI002DD6AF44|nr:hypothetical protein [Pseudorhodoferax sp.]